MELEINKTYRTRNGTKVLIDAFAAADPMPYKSDVLCWQANGRYWDDDVNHPLDIVPGGGNMLEENI